MDSYGDVVGVLVVLAMIQVGWRLARAAWDEPSRPRPRPGTVIDLRPRASHDRPG